MMLLFTNRADSSVNPQKIKYADQYDSVMALLKETIATAVGGTFDAKVGGKDEPKGRECIVSLEAEGAFVLVVSNIEDNDRCHRRLLEAIDNHECVSRYFHPNLHADFYNTRMLARVYYAPGMVRPFDPERDLKDPSDNDRKMVKQYAIAHNCTEAEADDAIYESMHAVACSNSFNADTIMRVLKSLFRSDWD